MIVKIMSTASGIDYLLADKIKFATLISDKEEIERFKSNAGGSFMASNKHDVPPDANHEGFRKMIVATTECGETRVYEFYTRAYLMNDEGKTIEVIN